MLSWFSKNLLIVASSILFSGIAEAALSIPVTVHMSEPVIVSGIPRVAVDVGGEARYATYTSGSGTTALTFTLMPQAGDVDLDGIVVSSPIDLNGGALKDTAGNNAVLTFAPPNTSGIKVNYPSLGMDFVYDADGRYTLNGTAYNDLSSFLSAAGGTFTRTSAATYFDSAGVLQVAGANTPRFDYDPITHAQKGLLIESSRTNGTLRSSELDNAVWTKNAVTVTGNATTAPDGTLSADLVVPTTALINYRTVQQPTPSLVTGTTYTVTAYAKAGGYNYATIVVAANNGRATYNLTTGASTSYAVATPSTTYVGNGWWRLNFKFTSIITGVTQVWFGAVSSYMDPYTSYSGDGTSGVYLWGMQFETGSYPTSYIPTTSAAVTRAMDNLVIPSGSWYNTSEGTLFVAATDTRPTTVSAGIWVGLGNVSTINDRCQIYGSSTNAVVQNYTGGVSQVQAVLGSRIIGTNKISYALKDNDFAFTLNGGAVATDSSGTLGAKTLMTVGKGADYGSEYIDGTILQVKYYPTRIQNAQLPLLTQ